MCTRNTIPDCRYDDGHVGSCEPWPAWAAALREENARLRGRLRDMETFAQSREWTVHDETRDYCITCGGSKPEPDDRPGASGHMRGCPTAALLSLCRPTDGPH